MLVYCYITYLFTDPVKQLQIASNQQTETEKFQGIKIIKSTI